MGVGWCGGVAVRLFVRFEQHSVIHNSLIPSCNINSLTMPSAKSDIQSKKTKQAEKEQRRQKMTVKPIEISSSEEEPPTNNKSNHTRNPPPPLVQQPPRKYNVFNIDRLKKIEVVPILQVEEKELAVQENTKENPMAHTDARSLFSYRIEGNESTKYVSDLFLEQRLKKIAEEQGARQAKEKQKEKEKQAEEDKERLEKEEGKDEEGQEQAKGEEEEEEEKKQSRPVRYFQSFANKEGQEERDMVKCFRCNKRGHIAKNCLQQRELPKCLYCLGDHHHHDCVARACFKCNELGHIAQECRSVAIQCRRCRKKGHAQKQCGIIVFLDYSRIKSDQEFRQKYTPEDLRKIRCLAGCAQPNGHFNCHQYKQLNTKHAPYATYHSNNQLNAFKNMSRYQYSDFDSKYQRKERQTAPYKHRGYEREERYQRPTFDRGDRFQSKKSNPKSKHKSQFQSISYEGQNNKYNIRSDYNINQRINQRYDYNGGNRGRW